LDRFISIKSGRQSNLSKPIWLQWRKQSGHYSAKNSIIATGRSLFAPLAQLFALGCEELGTKPVLCNETGMFRHGPMEILDSDTVLVVFGRRVSWVSFVPPLKLLRNKAGVR
jgi:fructoselysine-6-P-deglycase FrlB-like protein